MLLQEAPIIRHACVLHKVQLPVGLGGGIYGDVQRKQYKYNSGPKTKRKYVAYNSADCCEEARDAQGQIEN